MFLSPAWLKSFPHLNVLMLSQNCLVRLASPSFPGWLLAAFRTLAVFLLSLISLGLAAGEDNARTRWCPGTRHPASSSLVCWRIQPMEQQFIESYPEPVRSEKLIRPLSGIPVMYFHYSAWRLTCPIFTLRPPGPA